MQDLYSNEGTKTMTKIHLKHYQKTFLKTGNSKLTKISNGIVIVDTRGHIFMNENEKE